MSAGFYCRNSLWLQEYKLLLKGLLRVINLLDEEKEQEGE